MEEIKVLETGQFTTETTVEPETHTVTTVATVEPENKPEAKKLRIKMGTVSGCTRLNVRNHPDKSAAVVTTIEEGVEVAVDMNRKYDEWYSVCTASGIEGYCMKEFITIQQ